MTLRERINRFLQHNGIAENRFTGKVTQNNAGQLLMGYIFSLKENKPIVSYKGIALRIRLNKDEFIEGDKYEFSIHINFDKDKDVEYFVIDTKYNPPIKIVPTKLKTNVENPLIQQLLLESHVNSNRFYGIVSVNDNGNLFMTEILSKEEGNLLLDERGNRRRVYIGNGGLPIKINGYYEFSIHAQKTQDGIPFFVVDQINFPPIEIDFNPYQEIVRLRYEHLDNPDANRMIAHLMREIGKGLYSSKQRMIFELLQNADDTPAGDEVSFHIAASDDYLLFMHNGLPFNKDDVEAITSAAESTKKNDRKKTGYKGIGFKSVFTDSDEVVIKSGGFLFAFRRNHPGFKDFDSFYFSKKRYQEIDPKYLEEDKLKYSKQRLNFQGNTDIPWQLIPIWVREVPEELKDTSYVKFNNNVGIAIKFGRELVNQYLESISSITENPHFMLFLRHVNLFKVIDQKPLSIRKTGNNPVFIEREYGATSTSIFYLKKEVENIEVNDSALHNEGVLIYKKERVNDYGEVLFYFSSDEKGEKELEDIPPKLAAFENTSITLAAPIQNGKIKAEDDYLNNTNSSSFYTYLPMKEQRLHLPFLVNADFVPDSSREKLQGDNKWNEYLISKIAFHHVQWLSELAIKSVEDDQIQTDYLSLLLKDLLPNEESINLLVNKYNTVYQKQIQEIPFILSETRTIEKTESIVIDETGISTLLGSDFFHQLSDLQKLLPHKELNIQYLRYFYLNIEVFTYESFFEKISSKVGKEFLRNRLSKLDKEEYESFFLWFNNVLGRYEIGKEELKETPFIRLGNQIYSISEILNSENHLIKTENLSEIAEILDCLDFKLSECRIDQYENIWEKLDVFNISDFELYEKIKKSSHLTKLDPKQKNKLIQFVEKLDRIGKTRYANELALFSCRDKSKNLKPLSKLISNNVIDLPSWLEILRIDSQEEEELDKSFQKYLISGDRILNEIISNSEYLIEITNDLNIDLIGDFYQFILEESIRQVEPPKGFSDLPIIFSTKENKFKSADEFYFPDTLIKLDKRTYQSVTNIISRITPLDTPPFEAIGIINKYSLGSSRKEITASIEVNKSLSKSDLLIFLDFLVKLGTSDFFKRYNVVEDGELYTLTQLSNQDVIFCTSDNLKNYLLNLNIENLVILCEELFKPDYYKLGVLNDEMTIKRLLELDFVTNDLVHSIIYIQDDFLADVFLMKLKSIPLTTENEYSKESTEWKLFNYICKQTELSENLAQHIKSIIQVDGFRLTDKAYKNDLYFKNLNKEITIKLSDILPEYKTQSYSFSRIIEVLSGIDIKKLRSIFEPAYLDHNVILSKLNSLDQPFFNAQQTFYLLHLSTNLNIPEIFKFKKPFTEYYSLDKVVYEQEAFIFMEISLNEDYIDFIQKIAFPDLIFENTILDSKYAIDEEKAPSWFFNWLEKSQNDGKYDFVLRLGVNNSDSHIVDLRKGLAGDVSVNLDLARVNVNNIQLIRNTFKWMQINLKDGIIGRDVLAPLYEKALKLNVSVKSLLIPSLTNVKSGTYQLVEYSNEISYYKASSDWDDYENEIWIFLRSNRGHIIDDTLPIDYCRELSCIVTKPILVPDLETINSKLRDVKARFYQYWEKKNSCVIKIYKGDKLPFLVKFNGSIITRVEKDSCAKIDSYFVVAESIEESIPGSIKELIPEFYAELNSQKTDFEKKVNDIRYSDKEIDAIKKLFDGVVPEEFHKNLNLAALVSAIVNLPVEGYDTDSAGANLAETHEYAQLFPVYYQDPQKLKPLTIMCRSSRKGLLYMSYRSWKRLGDNEIYLYADTGHGEFKLFKSKQDVLEANDNSTDYQLIRIETEASAQNIDKILTGNFDDESKIWMVFRVKENKTFDSLFYKKQEPDNSISNNIGYRYDNEGITY